ncbi:MAG: CoA-binding protein [Acidimicrobiales bacterium]
MAPSGDDDVVRRVLSMETWAVVGCSPDPDRPSYGVAAFLLAQGKRVIPVNPACTTILDQPCYPTLEEIPADVPVDVVDLFRRTELVGPHVDEAVSRGVSAVWMQLGVIDLAAAERARVAGLDVVVDRCPRIEWPRLFPRSGDTSGGGRL